MPGAGSRWRRFADRLATAPQEQEARDLRDVAGKWGATPISEVRDRQMADVCGTIRTVSVRPKSENVPALVVELDDGSRMLRLVWLGRRHIAGIQPGAYLSAHGRVCMRSGTPTIFNPSYELRRNR